MSTEILAQPEMAHYNNPAFQRWAGDTSGLVYYNALTVNNGMTPIPAAFSSVESSPIVSRPRDYHLSVVRFFLSARNTLPIFWWQQTPSLSLPQQIGVYNVSLSYGGTVVTENLVFRTQDLGGTPPPNSDRLTDADNAAYWGVYAHSSFIEAINGALKSCYHRLGGYQPTNPPHVAGCMAPFVMFMPGTALLSIVAGRPFSQLYAGEPTVKIWMNNQLYTFFSESLQYEDRYYPGTNPISPDCDFSLWIGDRGGVAPTQQFALITNPQWLSDYPYVTNQLAEYDGVNYLAIAPSTGAIPPSSPGSWAPQGSEVFPDWTYTAAYTAGNQVLYNGQYYIAIANNTGVVPSSSPASWEIDSALICYNIVQDYQSVYRWIAIDRYILVGNGITAVTEILPDANGGFNSNSQPFLIDFNPDYSTSADAAGTGAGNVLYTPTAEYKRIELQGDTPLKNVQLQVFVMTNTGVQLPVYLGPQGSFSCKMLFEKKWVGDKR